MKYFMLLIVSVLITDGAKIKIIDGPFLFNNPAAGVASPRGDTAEIPLIPRVDPKRTSVSRLNVTKEMGVIMVKNVTLCGKKVLHETLTSNISYKYIFCPFQNVTQREQTYRWNAFHGVLGVWKEWNIVNNTFESMLFVHGDVCSPTLDRQVKVFLLCGEKNEIVSAKEPSMCRYEMEFKTPYACPLDVFDVYPMLSVGGKRNYKEIEKSYLLGDITEKGYTVKRKHLFIKESLIVEDEKNDGMRSRMRQCRGVRGRNKGPKESSLPTNNDVKEEILKNLTVTFKSKDECELKYEEMLAQNKNLSLKLKKLNETLCNMMTTQQQQQQQQQQQHQQQHDNTTTTTTTTSTTTSTT